MDADEIMDGLALWDEHKPQTGEDWRAVARRCLADPSNLDPTPLFAGLLAAEQRVAELEDVLRRVLDDFGKARPADDWYFINDAEALIRGALKGNRAES